MNNAKPPGAEPVHRREENLDAILIEHGGWLVQNENARINRDGLRDLHHLLLRDAEVSDNVLRRNSDAKLLEHLRRSGSHQSPIDDAKNFSRKPAKKKFSSAERLGASDNS